MAKIIHCEVVTEYVPEYGGANFQLTCGADAVTLYESTFSQTPVTATLSLTANPSPCRLTITVTEGDGTVLPPIIILPNTGNRAIRLTIGSLKRITLGCDQGTQGAECSGYYSLQLRYCKCCRV